MQNLETSLLKNKKRNSDTAGLRYKVMECIYELKKNKTISAHLCSRNGRRCKWTVPWRSSYGNQSNLDHRGRYYESFTRSAFCYSRT
jgi:hypothetical protein